MIMEESRGSVGTETVRLGGPFGLPVRDALEVLCYSLKQDTKIILCLVFAGALNSFTTIFGFYLICHIL